MGPQQDLISLVTARTVHWMQQWTVVLT